MAKTLIHSLLPGEVNTSTRRVGVGVGFNHINTRAYAVGNKKALPRMNTSDVIEGDR